MTRPIPSDTQRVRSAALNFDARPDPPRPSFGFPAAVLAVGKPSSTHPAPSARFRLAGARWGTPSRPLPHAAIPAMLASPSAASAASLPHRVLLRTSFHAQPERATRERALCHGAPHSVAPPASPPLIKTTRRINRTQRPLLSLRHSTGCACEPERAEKISAQP